MTEGAGATGSHPGPGASSISTENAELLTPRDLRRDFARRLDSLTKGEIEKLVLMQRNQMVAVVIPFDRYRELVQGDPDPK